MKQFFLLLLISACISGKAQTTGNGTPITHVTMSNGTEVSANCNKKDNVIEVQVERNNEYLEVFVIKDGEVEDYDATIMNEDTLTFNITDSESNDYIIYVRTNDDENCINIDAEEE